MRADTKQKALHVAEVIDSWRVVPRLFFASYFGFWCWITMTLILWYIHLPSAERTLEASGFGGAIFTAATGFLKTIYDTYSKTSRDWNAQPMQTVTTVAASTTTTGSTP